MAQNRDSVSVANNPGKGTLHDRLLAEIERREGVATTAIAAIEARDPDRWWGHEASPMEYEEFIDANDPATVLAYLAALRGVVELHADNGIGCCRTCGDEAWGDDYPCATLRYVAEGLGVEVE